MDQTQIAEKLQIIQDGINTEGDLINQIAAALEDKATGGGADSNIEICSLTLKKYGKGVMAPDFLPTGTIYYTSSNFIPTTEKFDCTNDCIFLLPKNTLFLLTRDGLGEGIKGPVNVTQMLMVQPTQRLYVITDNNAIIELS